MSSALQFLTNCRAKKATLRVNGLGEIKATGLDAEMKQTLKAMRPAIVEALWAEKKLWTGEFPGSKFDQKLGALYELVKSKEDSFDVMSEVGELLEILLEIHAACLLGHDQGVAKYRERATLGWNLVKSIRESLWPGQLVGEELRDAALEVFEVVA